MSNVRVKDRTESRFAVLDKALDLYDYTTKIISNDKIFDRRYSALIDKIDDAATLIYHYCRAANDLDARDRDQAAMHLALEKEAIEQCRWLKTYVFLAQRKFHLRAKRTIYWTQMVNGVMDMIAAWNKSEVKRFREDHGL